jgi:protein ImuB
MRRILCAWLPNWPTPRLRRLAVTAPDRPLATVATVRGERRLAAVCPRAEAFGLHAEQTLAEARALCPGLDAIEADPAADQAALAALAGWCERYTPLVAPDAPDGLVLDITGCAHLFGDEATLAAALAVRLARNGLPARIAVAGTPAAAWALARAIGEAVVTVVPPGGEAAALAPLPVGLLRLEARTILGLRRLGIRRIGELARLPRAEVSVRFGPRPVLRLDQALGAATEAIAWLRPPPPWAERLAFAEPIGTPDDLARALALLAERLCARLEAARRGGHRFAATCFRLDDARPRIAMATALPVRDAAYVARLLVEKLETVDPGFGIEAMLLEAEETAPLAPPQTTFGDLAAPAGTGLATTVDELANRLGEDRLWRVAPQESHVPERSVRRLPPLAAAPAWEHDPAVERPLRLLRRPEPIEATAPVPDDPPILFRWRGAPHRVRAASGPERIAAEWWRRRPVAGERPETDLVRDYYRVEDSDGARFWIFRTGRDGGGPTTRWFLHGLFG